MDYYNHRSISREDIQQQISELGYIHEDELKRIMEYYEKRNAELTEEVCELRRKVNTLKNLIRILRKTHEDASKIFNSVWINQID